MTLTEKVAYLKGLMEGMDFSGDPSREKLFAAMADLLTEISDRVLSMEELMDDLNDYVESIDDDLAELEGSRSEGNMRFMDDDDEDEDDGLHILDAEGHEDICLQAPCDDRCKSHNEGYSHTHAERGVHLR